MKKFQQGDVLFKEIDKEEFLQLKEKEEKKHFSNFKVTSGFNSCDVYDKNIEMKMNNSTSGEYTLSNTKCTVALGEATGHHHRFETATTGTEITAYSNFGWKPSDDPAQCDYVVIKGDGDVNDKNAIGTLTHEEHNPIEIPSGYYKVDIVKEFDHFSQLTRSVVD